MKKLLCILSFFIMSVSIANDNSCRYAYDGYCDDGGRGSDYSACELGTDLNDCGRRRIRRGGGNGDNRRTDLRCISSGVFGKHAYGGGCNAFGCFYPNGGCNAFGCWYAGGDCNAFGCTSESAKTRKACHD